MLTDVEIAQSAKMKPIVEVAQKVGLDEDDLELYGKYKAKISLEAIKKLDQNEDGKLILVTAINPTPAGEGKTTTMIGLSQALNKLGKKSVVAMREPSLGPCFGIKGGAAGGGYAQVVPMEDINLHFTGDIHAITAANNLIAAMLDNSIHQGNPLNIDVRQIVWKRVVDLNDRALRHTVCGLGGKVNGVPREDGFDITVASEVMAILCLATSLEDLKQRAAKMIVAYTYDGKPVTVDDIEATGAVTLLLKDAIIPKAFRPPETHLQRAERMAKPYLMRDIGGDALECVSDVVFADEKGKDGIIHISPFTCMPEIMSQNIFPTMREDHEIPILTLIMDEQTGKAGYITRLEAFVDLMRRKKRAKLGKLKTRI